jgi:shikimate 5-dehydrogenase
VPQFPTEQTNAMADKFSDFYHREVIPSPDAEAAQTLSAVQDATSQEIPEKKHDTTFQDSQQKKDQTTVEVNSVPPTPLLELNDPQYRSKSTRPPISRN